MPPEYPGLAFTYLQYILNITDHALERTQIEYMYSPDIGGQQCTYGPPKS